MKSSVRRPSRSMSHRPTKVKIRLVTPMPTDCSSAAFAPSPVSLENARREVEHRVDAGELVEEGDQESPAGSGCARRRVQKCADDAFAEEAAAISSAWASICAVRGFRFDELQHLQTGLAVALPARSASAGFREGQSTAACREATETPRRRASSARHSSPMPASSALETKAMRMPKTMLN